MSSRRDLDLLQFDGTSVLVSGGAGFIGSHLVDRLIEEGAQVRVIDDMSNGLQSNIERWKGNRNFKFMKGDVRNREMMKEAVTDVSIVFHHAAKVSVPESSRDPHTVMDVNIMGTTSILDECRKCDVESVIVASSSSVYGNTPRLPKVESMPTQPISPYGVSKLAQENLAVVFSSTYGLDTVVLRYFNVYGPRQRVGSYAGVIQLFVASALRGEPLFIDGDGQQTRDFTYVDDAVEGSILAALSSKTGARIYNV
ncbi:MAG: SDR family NAD(P)-dependent oxidoreductase, partial [Promethearchaeota archaeon]